MFADMMVVVIESCARASAVLCAAWALTSVMRRASAATRHFVWSCAIAGAILASVLGSLGPRWPVSIPSTVALAPSVVSLESLSDTATADAPVPSADPAAGIPDATTANTSALVPGSIDVAFVLGLVWTMGALAVLGYAVTGLFGAWLLRRSATSAPAHWVEEARTLAEAFEIAGVIDLLQSRAIAMPIVCGIWHPLIVLPTGAGEWSDERRRVVVLHELAHIKRRDCLTQRVAQIVCAVYWFNPIVWLAARRLRIERERACDDFVLAAGEKGPDYAAHLLEIAQTVRHDRAPAMAGLAMARPSQLEGRLLAILNPAVRRSSALHTRLASLGLVAMVSLPVGAVEFIGTSSPAEAIDTTAVAPTTASTAPIGDAVTSATPAPVVPAPSSVVVPLSPSPSPSPSPSAPSPDSAMASLEFIAEVNGHSIGMAAGQVLGALMGQTAGAAIASQTTTAGDPKTIDALIGALNDPDPDVRETVVMTLGRMRDPKVVTALLPLLQDSSASVREHAVFALARSGDPRATAAVSAMIDDASPEVREQAVHLLGRSRNRDAVPVLVKALKDSSEDVREQAAFGLGQLRDVSAVDPLLGMLKDSAADVREQSAFALGQIRDRRAVDGLAAALKDANPSVREQAAFALGQIRDPGALPALTTALRDSAADVREQAAFAIGQISGQQ
jgi:HEAT repeat protein/beta-lactamase regulating signal transducer with metallopeptidase domain